jgi:hypothetical protein
LSNTIIDPRKVLLAMPCHSGRNHAELTGALISTANRFHAFFPLMECSHPSLARNVIAEVFMNRFPQCEWLVCVDDDIAFHPEDLDILLEPCDLSADYDKPGMQQPTRVTTSLAIAGESLDNTTIGAADALVCAQYRYKRDEYDVVNLGMGFVRIHRSVFEQLQKMEHPKNPDATEYEELLHRLSANSESAGLSQRDIQTLEACRPGPGGGPRLWQAQRDGRVIWDYFPSGPILSTFIPTADWKGEDHGFFTLCMLAGVFPRIETRTRLTHIGRKGYHYMGADVSEGQ